jgi:hypothetical protein
LAVALLDGVQDAGDVGHRESLDRVEVDGHTIIAKAGGDRQ